MRTTFARAGLPDVWREALFPRNTGDGFSIVFDTRHLPAVVTRFFDTLQNVLAERDLPLRTHGRGLRMRMRASLNIGPVRDVDSESDSCPAGAAMVTTHRLLDAAVVRNALARSDPDQTFVSVALSQRVFDDVVSGGYASLPASRVVQSRVQIKEFTGIAYLYVPNPSGELLRYGLGRDGGRGTEPAAARLPPPGSTTNIMTGTHSGVTLQVGHLHGGVHSDRDT